MRFRGRRFRRWLGRNMLLFVLRRGMLGRLMRVRFSLFRRDVLRRRFGGWLRRRMRRFRGMLVFMLHC